jgi:hypothetical protein
MDRDWLGRESSLRFDGSTRAHPSGYGRNVGAQGAAQASRSGHAGRFAERALRNRRLAWALLAEPVDPLVDAERLAFREA